MRHLDGIESFAFAANKYNSELYVDVAWIDSMPLFRKTSEPHTLQFYEVTLITSGIGSFWLDETHYPLKVGQVLFTTPGQVRRWYADSLKGICLLFPASFFLNTFVDPLLLHRFHYFHTKVGPGDLILNNIQYELLQSKLLDMHNEIASLKSDSNQVLMAHAYAILLLLNRWYTNAFGQVQEKSTHSIISKFRLLLDSQFHNSHKVADYATMLCVTPGHLNVLCKTHLGCNASQLIQQRLLIEAKRYLVHSFVPINELSVNLGYADHSYFCRVFKREVGITPLQYRKKEFSTIGAK